MQIDPQHSLQLAFQHLEAFSLPGVGTFKRSYFAAFVDHAQKKIIPPGERFVLEKGDSQLGQLEDFYFRYLDLSINRAKELVSEVSKFVLAEIKEVGRLVLPGWGELSSGESDKVEFAHLDELEGTADAFFGLQPVSFSLGDLVATDEKSRTAAAIASVDSNTTRVEPLPPPKRKRSRRPLLILLLILLLIGSGAGMIWKAEFMGFLDKIGVVNNQGNGSLAKIDSVIPKDTAGTMPVVVDTAEHRTPLSLADSVETVEAKSVEVKEDVVAKPLKDKGLKPGVYAQKGNYYLVVAAAGSGDEAKTLQRKFRKNGAKPQIIASRGRGLYKISVFHSKDKMQVINKMVEWKNTFSKSWIYWPGM